MHLFRQRSDQLPQLLPGVRGVKVHQRQLRPEVGENLPMRRSRLADRECAIENLKHVGLHFSRQRAMLLLQIEILVANLVLLVTSRATPTTVITWPSSGLMPFTKKAGFSRIASPTITPDTPVVSMHLRASSRLRMPPLENTGIESPFLMVAIASQSQGPTFSLFCSRVRPWTFVSGGKRENCDHLSTLLLQHLAEPHSVFQGGKKTDFHRKRHPDFGTTQSFGYLLHQIVVREKIGSVLPLPRNSLGTPQIKIHC